MPFYISYCNSFFQHRLAMAEYVQPYEEALQERMVPFPEDFEVLKVDGNEGEELCAWPFPFKIPSRYCTRG